MIGLLSQSPRCARAMQEPSPSSERKTSETQAKIVQPHVAVAMCLQPQHTGAQEEEAGVKFWASLGYTRKVFEKNVGYRICLPWLLGSLYKLNKWQ